MHLIFDFETIGPISYKCPALDLSAFKFDWERFTSNTPYTFEEVVKNSNTWKLDIKHQVDTYGYSYTKSDLKFWADQDKHVREKILPTPNDLKVKEFCNSFISWLSEDKITYWWSRSNMFDPVILERLMVDGDMYNRFKNYLKFWNVRDTRTYIDAKLGFNNNKFIPMKDHRRWNMLFDAHDSRHDIAADVLRLQSIVRAEEGLEYD